MSTASNQRHVAPPELASQGERRYNACDPFARVDYLSEEPLGGSMRQGTPSVATDSDERDAFGYWFSGFADGESSFVISLRKGGRGRTQFSFQICLRADDKPILDEIRDRLGFGGVYTREARRTMTDTNPQAMLVINGRSLCLRLVEVFDRYPLRAKKASDYAIWRQALIAAERDLWQEVERLRLLLKESRRYDVSIELGDALSIDQLSLLEEVS